LQDAFTRRGKPLQQEGRVLVAAVLRPEEREDSQLEVVRLTLEQLDDARELPVGETEGAVDRKRVQRLIDDLGQVRQCSREARRQSTRFDPT
jgi:hypothetical protein